MNLTLNKNEILVLKNVREDMTSCNGFLWPESGIVEAPDWNPCPSCGGGLHGLPWGVGGHYWYIEPSKWLVVRVCVDSDYLHGSGEMTDKCKFRVGEVVYCGDRRGAIALIADHAPTNLAINFLVLESGDRSTQTAGYGSTQKAGHWSTQKAGYESTQTAGYESTQTAGDGSTQKAGYGSTQKAGHWSTQTASDGSTQTAGDKSTQTAGYGSTQKAGVGTVQIIRWYDYGSRVKTRIIDASTANKWYKFERGDWRLCTDAEVKELGAKDGDA